ncbi:MAG: AAA family ATPase [Lentisphaeria bacterium]
MQQLRDQIRQAVLARNPIIYLHTPEEDRLLDILKDLANEDQVTVHEWSCVNGFEHAESTEASSAPASALQTIAEGSQPGFFIMKDLSPFMQEPAVKRALRDVYYAHKRNRKICLFILDPQLDIPEGLQREIRLIECPPPSETEIRDLVGRCLSDVPEASLSEEQLQEVSLALKGLTLSEVEHILYRLAAQKLHEDTSTLIDEIFAEKQFLVKKSGFLEFSPPRTSVDNIGGLEVLKDWLKRRKPLFSQEAMEAGIPPPKGLLVMGVSGCGKSMAVKAISALWNVPMFRLDMNMVMSGQYGSKETAFHKALHTIESVAPAILWIDEIENALGIREDGLDIDSHIFSSFLTWMQEKPPLVFIAATANKIQALPAEIIRKGRFDEVFFVDLPTRKEAEEILKINLRKYGADPNEFDFQMLGVMIEGWNGAEIEQAVISARTNAYSEKRQFSMQDLNAVANKVVPLSRTMEEQIKQIKSWAFSRATPASKYGRTRRR